MLNGAVQIAGGGAYDFVENFPARYIADLTKRPKLKRQPQGGVRLRQRHGRRVRAAGARSRSAARSCRSIASSTTRFPNYNPNPEDMKMLHAMRDAVLASKADVGLGFDGDGDRCGVVDDEGEEIFADKIGVMLARDISAPAQERAVRRRREIDRAVRDRSGADQERRQGRLLEDRPFLHEAPRQRDRRARRLREVRPFLLQQAVRPRL